MRPLALLRELILKAVDVGNDYAADGAAARLMRVVIDENQGTSDIRPWPLWAVVGIGFLIMMAISVAMMLAPFFHKGFLKRRDAKGLMKAAIREDNPVFVVQHKRLGRIREEVPEGDYIVPIGQADIKREGTAATIVTYGLTLHYALQAADQLSQEDGVEIEVVDLRTLKPLDAETVLASVRKTNRVIITDEEVQRGGSSAELAALIAEACFDDLDAPVMRLGGGVQPVDRLIWKDK